MAKKKKTKKHGLIRRWYDGLEEETRRSFRRGIGNFVFLVLLGLCIAFGLRELEQWVVSRQAENQKSLTVQLASPPEWTKKFPQIVYEVLSSSGIKGEDRLLDADLAGKVGRNVSRCPWVREIREVRKFKGNRIVVDCEIRKPMALVFRKGRYYLVDSDYVRLPGVYRYRKSHPIKDLHVIYGVLSPPPEPGKVWPGKDLPSGVRLAKLLQRQPYGNEISAVHVGNFSGRADPRKPHIYLTTPKSTKIYWGRAPGSEGRLEQSPEEKLRGIMLVYLRFKTIDGKMEYIDVRDPQPRFRYRVPDVHPTSGR
jgi:hypothetical protein